MAFIFPIIKNCLPADTIHARNSRNSENGGLVTMISASSRSLHTSLQDENLALSLRLFDIELWVFLLKEGWLVAILVLL